MTVNIGGFEFPEDSIVSSERLPALPGSGASGPQMVFDAAWSALGLAPYEREWVFHPARNWRLDVAWPGARVCLEVDGGVWGVGPVCRCCGNRQAGRHLTGKGFIEDCEKLNAATMLGWAVVRWPTDWIGEDFAGFHTDRAEALDRFIGTRAIGISTSYPEDLG